MKDPGDRMWDGGALFCSNKILNPLENSTMTRNQGCLGGSISPLSATQTSISERLNEAGCDPNLSGAFLIEIENLPDTLHGMIQKDG